MKRRSESSFGLHFDFHASPAPGRVVGATLKEEDIREICQTIKPDFIQIDCKGHPGWASYPTELGNAMPEMAIDTLEMWRRVTREEGVALYMHYSGVWDGNYCAKNPEDGVMNADGSHSNTSTRTLGPYVDKLLIPQLKELAGKYGVDGVWIDGDCWASQVDCHPDTIAAFEAETGIKLNGKAPVSRDDKYFDEYLEFNRELFRRYVRHYTDAVHAEYPDFQIASNWSFTDHMPEAVTANVDFLSGDFNPWNSFNVARYAGRAIAQQNKTWDLMAWNFRHQINDKPQMLTKHPVQIMQEAASVISIGGGFQNYITQFPDGSPRMVPIRRMKSVADFVRAREEYCVRGKAVHEAVILLSAYDRYHASSDLFSRRGYEKTVGLTSLICDSSQPVEIACEHTLRGNCGDYKMIAIPELMAGLDEDMIAELLDYAKAGGSLLLTGVNTCRIFSKYLPITIDDADRAGQWRWTSPDHDKIGKLRDAHDVICEGAETVVWYGNDEADTSIPGGVILPYGKGKIAILAANIGEEYLDCAQFVHRDIIKSLCQKLYDPMVKVEESLGLLEITELMKNEKLYIQLVNANGQHAGTSTATEDFIPPVVDVTLSIALEKAPSKLILRPEGRELDFDYEDGRAVVKIDRVNMHDIVEVAQ